MPRCAVHRRRAPPSESEDEDAAEGLREAGSTGPATAGGKPRTSSNPLAAPRCRGRDSSRPLLFILASVAQVPLHMPTRISRAPGCAASLRTLAATLLVTLAG